MKSEFLIKNLGKVITGNTPSKLNREFYDSNDIHFIKPDLISYSTITKIYNSNEYLSEKARYKARIVPKHTVLVTCIGNIGKVGYVTLDEVAFNQQINAIITNDLVLPRYLAYALIANQKQLEAIANAPVVPLINKTQFENFSLSIHNDIEEQAKVINILDKLSNIIELKKVELNEYDQLIKSRFVEMFENDMNYKNSWKIDYLGNLVTIVRGASPRPIQSFITEDENGINWIKIGDAKVDSMYIWATKEKITPEGAKKSRHVKEGDFLLSNSMSFGRPYILKTTGCVHDGWLVLSKYEDHFNKYFLYALLNSETVYNKFKSMVVGGVVNNLNSEMVRNLEVFVPPIDIQNEFARILKQIDKLKFEVLKLPRELR